MATAPLFQPPELPLTFREELAPHVYRALGGGFSLALVGVAGGGLSNALRFLAQLPVAVCYWASAPPRAADFVEASSGATRRRCAASWRAVLTGARVQQWPRAEQSGAAAGAGLTSQCPPRHAADRTAGLCAASANGGGVRV
jgi:hypothetical protein